MSWTAWGFLTFFGGLLLIAIFHQIENWMGDRHHMELGMWKFFAGMMMVFGPIISNAGYEAEKNVPVSDVRIPIEHVEISGRSRHAYFSFSDGAELRHGIACPGSYEIFTDIPSGQKSYVVRRSNAEPAYEIHVHTAEEAVYGIRKQKP